MIRRLLIALVFTGVAACSTYRNDLNRGQRLYEDTEYERALAIWRYLEPDLDSLGPADQARYAYLRGMTDYRLSGGESATNAEFRAHARHWLAVAKAIEQEHPGALSNPWKLLLEEALADLNAEVYGIGGAPSLEGATTGAATDAAVAPATSMAAPGVGSAAPAATVPVSVTAPASGGSVAPPAAGGSVPPAGTTSPTSPP
ncbi:MAG: hypothetical protein JW751_28025 [Polyangiaceae bacterium]|nr:hypothetical protein [Polyangiaceae bacterium]